VVLLTCECLRRGGRGELACRRRRGEEPAGKQDRLSGGAEQEAKECAGLRLALSSRDDSSGLPDGRVAVLGQQFRAGLVFQQRPGCDDHVSITGAGILVGLPDVFGQYDPRLKQGPESCALQQSPRGSAVWRVLRVGDRDQADLGIAQNRETRRRPPGRP